MAPKVQSPNAAVAFGTTAYALKIRPYWLAKILQGEKRVEIRGGRCPHPERITLMETGSLLLRARATITQSHLMTDAELLENQEAVSAPWLQSACALLVCASTCFQQLRTWITRSTGHGH